MVTLKEVRIPENVARGAAKWWADNLNGGFDNGDPMQGAFVDVLSAKAGGPYRPTAEERQRFEDHLAAEIMEGMSHIGVDYHPDSVLCRAAEAGGFRDAVNNLIKSPIPIKTSMHIYPTYAVAGLGYGAPYKIVAGERPPHFETEVAPGTSVTTESYDALVWRTDVSLWLPSTSRPRVEAHSADEAKQNHDAVVARVQAAVDELGLPLPPSIEPGKRMYQWTGADVAAYHEQDEFSKKVAVIFYRENR